MPNYKLLVSVEGVSTMPTQDRVFKEYVVTLRQTEPLTTPPLPAYVGRSPLPDVEVLGVPSGNYRIEIGAYDTGGRIFGAAFFSQLSVGSAAPPTDDPTPFILPGGFSFIAVPMT